MFKENGMKSILKVKYIKINQNMKYNYLTSVFHETTDK